MAIRTVGELRTVLSNFPDQAPVSIGGDYGYGATIWIANQPVIDESDFEVG